MNKPSVIQTELKCEPYASRDLGEQIVVLDRGFVYVGKVTIDGEFVTMDEAGDVVTYRLLNSLGWGYPQTVV